MKPHEKPFGFGTSDPLPLKGFPKGIYRIRLRPDAWARVYVKTKDGIRAFIPEIQGDNWIPGPELARNIRGTNTEDQ